MIDHQFDIASRVENGRLVLEMRGDINSAAAARLEEAYQGLDDPAVEGVVLDFEKVEYINSTGIALIVALLARARAADKDVVAFGLTEHYRQIFQITRLADFVGIYPDRSSALRAVAT
ncbi:MAG TPA: STAS domain-containing protein [Acidimicrobiia bacterium]|nr:STAS domain-containing protein [Acidimicrobiia bacterium]